MPVSPIRWPRAGLQLREERGLRAVHDVWKSRCFEHLHTLCWMWPHHKHILLVPTLLARHLPAGTPSESARAAVVLLAGLAVHRLYDLGPRGAAALRLQWTAADQQEPPAARRNSQGAGRGPQDGAVAAALRQVRRPPLWLSLAAEGVAVGWAVGSPRGLDGPVTVLYPP